MMGADSGTPSSLAEFVLAPDYHRRVSDIALRVSQATEEWAVLQALHEATVALGAQRAVFVSLVQESREVTACRFLLACAPDWCNVYLEFGLIEKDPWLAYAIQQSEPAVATSIGSDAGVGSEAAAFF